MADPVLGQCSRKHGSKPHEQTEHCTHWNPAPLPDPCPICTQDDPCEYHEEEKP